MEGLNGVVLGIGRITFVFIYLGKLSDSTTSIPCKVNHEETQNKCLMTELEMAIACGNHQRAAILAKELAIKRAHCSLTNKQFAGGTAIKDKPARTSPIVYVFALIVSTRWLMFARFTFITAF